MASIQSKGTKLEEQFFSALAKKNILGIDRNPLDVIGKPDFVHRKSKTAVFLDSCFWHGCTQHLRMPHSNSEYWETKIERNRKRDKFVTRALRKEGWCVIRIWEHSLKSNLDIEKWAQKVEKVTKKTGALQDIEKTVI